MKSCLIAVVGFLFVTGCASKHQGAQESNNFSSKGIPEGTVEDYFELGQLLPVDAFITLLDREHDMFCMPIPKRFKIASFGSYSIPEITSGVRGIFVATEEENSGIVLEIIDCDYFFNTSLFYKSDLENIEHYKDIRGFEYNCSKKLDKGYLIKIYTADFSVSGIGVDNENLDKVKDKRVLRGMRGIRNKEGESLVTYDIFYRDTITAEEKAQLINKISTYLDTCRVIHDLEESSLKTVAFLAPSKNL